MNFEEEIIKLIVKNTSMKEEEVTNLLSTPPDPKLGDYSFPCFKIGGNPKEASEKLKEEINNIRPDFIEKMEVVGPYINFYLKDHVLAKEVLSKIVDEKEKYGFGQIGKGKTVVIDYSSPNIAKPMSIGHLRSTVIGNALYKVYCALGYKVVGVNHLGDWGTQFGKLIVAYKIWGVEKELQENPIKHLLDIYVKFHDEAEKDDNLNNQARIEFKKLEDGNKESIALWESFKELSIETFEKIYGILDVSFDHYHGEAFYIDHLDKVVEDVKKNVKTEISEGALIVDLDKYKMPPVLLKKSNGSTSYHTRDLAAALYRLKQFKADKLIYVVGMPQKLHFKQLFKVLELYGINKEFEHVDFGLIRLPEGKMSTRKGNVIFLEDVIDKAIELAEKVIEEKNPNLENKKEVAKQIGIGSIIFADLSNDRVRNINFDWDKMLSFEGETAPYVQYTHARACTLLKKALDETGVGVTPKINYETFNLKEEIAVLKELYKFPQVLVEVTKNNKPHVLANYLISLGQAYNEFYHKCPVISSVKHQMRARILLTDCVRQVIENGLGMLGIKAPERM